jgi:mono/diheme cytochrome c family protein
MSKKPFSPGKLVGTILLGTFWGCLFFVVQVSAEEPVRKFVDKSGNHSVQAKFLRLADGQVYLEKADGDEIKLPLAQLSEADQQYVNSAAQPKTPESGKPKHVDDTATFANEAELASKAKQILTDACYACHGLEGSNEGGFNFVLHVPRMTDGDAYIAPGDPAGSFLFERIASGEMPPEGEGVKFTEADAQTLKDWIKAGAPDFEVKTQIEMISSHEVEEVIFNDLKTFSDRERRYQRYFTLVHLYNAGTSQDELETYRKALSKLINSLSWSSEIVIPDFINQSQTILRLDLRAADWTPETWENLLAGYPYGYLTQAERGDAFTEIVNTRLPFIRADWFVAVASTPPLYHTLLQIPKTDGELETLLRIDVKNNIAGDRVIRAGFNRSGVSQNNRMIERHVTPYGAYWKSYDFAGSAGQQNLFEHPLGPGKEEQDFSHDGGEMIFTLPNGLNGYMLTDSQGNRLDAGPTQIVSDPGRPDKTVVNGISCMSCHYAGMIEKQDEIRTHVEKFPNAYPLAEDILAKYPRQYELTVAYQKDSARFARAMDEIGITKLTKSGEPISNMARRFESELDLNLACAELGITQEQFDSLLRDSNTLARSLGPLTQPGGTMKRDAFVQVFLDAVVEFKLGFAFRPEDGGFRFEIAASASISSTKSDDDPGEFLAIIEKLSSGSPNDQREAIRALQLNPPKTANKALTEAVANIARRSKFFQQDAINLLTSIDPKASKEVLIEIIASSDASSHFARQAAFKALATLKDPETVNVISTHLGGPNSRDAIEALVAIGEASEQAIYHQLEIDVDNFIKARPLIEALGKIGTKNSVADLKRLARNKNRFIAEDAQKALRQIEQRLTE